MNGNEKCQCEWRRQLLIEVIETPCWVEYNASGNTAQVETQSSSIYSADLITVQIQRKDDPEARVRMLQSILKNDMNHTKRDVAS